MNRALFVLCALLCLFVLSARSELNVPWPPSSPPTCSSTWQFEGEAYAFCHMDFTGSTNDNEWDGETVSEIIEPCNFHYFKIDAETYSGGLQVGDWLEVFFEYDTTNGTGTELTVFGRYEALPTEADYDFVFTANYNNVTFSISPYYVSLHASSTIWLAVGNFVRHDDTTDPADYSLTVIRYRPSRDCGDCVCDPTFGYDEITVSTTGATGNLVASGTFLSDFNDTRPELIGADPNYQRLRNFHFNVPSSLYHPGAYLDINVTVLNGTAALENSYISLGPYAVDPYTTAAQDNHKANGYFAATGTLDLWPCVNGDVVPGQTNHLIVPPCNFYYGDYYLSLLFVNSGCIDGATYEITVNVFAPIVNQLSVNVPFTNNLQDNIFLGAQASYSQFDHYVLDVTGTTGRTHAFARLSSVYGAQLGLFMRVADQTDNNIAFGNNDKTLVPYVWEYQDVAADCEDCYTAYEWRCETGSQEELRAEGDSYCGCYFIVPSCAFTDQTYYLSVVPGYHDGDYYVDGNSYHLEVNTYEDSLSVALAPGVPVVATLAVWTPFQAYTFATPNAVDTWAVVELFVRAPSTSNNQLAQPSLTLSLQQGYSPYDSCTQDDDYYKTCSTSGYFFAGGSDDGYSLSYPSSCNIFVDTCRLNSGPIYLVVYNDDSYDDLAPFGVIGGQWDYVLWADLENPWALESDVTYTDRLHGNFYNHYYIDVDDSIEAGSWLSVDFENIVWLQDDTSVSFAAFLNYESLAGECPCYEYVDVCQVENYVSDAADCTGDDACPTDVNGWEPEYNFDLPDNTYPVPSSFDTNNLNSASCRVQASVCTFRPGRWYVSTKAAGCKSEPASEGKYLIGYTVTAHIYDAPVVNELEFNEQITEQLVGSEIRHYQLTSLDAAGEDLVITVAWYEEVLSRFYLAFTDFTGTLPKSYVENWGIEVRLNFGDLAFEECYEHPWSCKASFTNGGSCQIIVPVCKWAFVDPEQIFISARFNRGLNESDEEVYVSDQLSGFGTDPIDVLAAEFWAGGAAQFNLLVSSERPEVTALAVNVPVYGSVKKDRYAHYSLQLLQTQGLRTNIDIYYNVQTAYDLSFEGAEAYYPVLALNQGSLAGDARGCRDCFTAARTCQNNAACHWTFDSCDGLDIDTTYYLSVYKPANAFYDQALEFALTVSQEDLIIPVALTSEGRLTSTIKLQDQQSTRAFFEIDGSSLKPRQSPYDALYITVWANGAYDAAFTAYLNHDGLAGACPCFGRICQQDFNLTTECPIAYHDDSDTEYRGALVDYNLEAGSYFVTLEFPAAHGSDAAVITIEADVINYPVFDITPTNLRESGPEFWLGDFDLPYGELLGDTTSADDADYNAGFNMDNWLIDNAGNIDWDLSNLFRNHVLNPRNFVQRYRITPPSRLDDLNWQNLNFYAVSIDSRNTVPGFPMPNRVYVGIDNIHGDHDNCDSLRSLSLSWYGTNNGETDRAVNPFLTSTVVDETRTTCSNYEDIDDYIATFIAQTSNGLLFTELPPCLFTHAGEAVHYFGVRSNGFLGWDVELSDSDTATLRGSVFYDIRFWIQKPIVLENIASFYTGANFVSEVVNAPYATNWQTFRYGSSAYNTNEFKQRFELDLTAEIAGMDAPFVQVVIEHEFAELTVTANADYPPNFNFDSDGCIDECNLRSVLEVRLNSLSAVQLPNVVVEGDAYFSDRASNSMNYLLPDSDVHYYSSANNGTFVFTLDPCALRQSANWFFDIISQDSNTSFFVYYTDPIDLLDANVVDITVADVEQRDWVPNSGDSVLLENLDDYSFLRLSIDDLNLFAAGLGRPRLEIQIDWLPQFDTDVLGLDQAAAIWITREEPLFLKGESASFPFNVQDNFAVPSDEFFIDSDFDDYDSYVDVCSDAFYMSSIGPDYNTTNFPARLGERFFLDGCDLAGTSEIWITARMLTAGYHDFQVLARVVADTIGTTNIPIADGYPDVAQVNIQSDTADAIEPFSFNHHSFVLPADLQNDADVQSTLIVELKFPDDDIDRYNGTFFLLFSTDAPAGFTGSLTPDNYEAVFDSRYTSSVEYGGLLTFGEQAGFNPFGSDSSAINDCYTNLIDYQSSELTFASDDTGIVPVGDFITEYRTRRNIDLYNFRYASTLWVSVFFNSPDWEELDPQEEDDVLGWQGYELRVWIQSEPATVPIAIERNITAADICWEVATDTGVDANSFDYNITWGVKSLTPTWFAFELTNDLVSLDCSDLDTADTECLFSQWLEFSIYNDWETSGGVVQDYTYSTGGNDFPELYVLDTYTVIGPARFSVGGTGDMYTSSSGNDIVAGEWTIHDSHLSSDRHFGSNEVLIAVNDSYTPPRFYPCSGAGGAGYGVDEDWVFNAEFVTPTATQSLRPGIYYIPVWSADSIDFTICASLNSFGYDTLWTDPASPYIPTEIDIDENGDDEEDVSVLAQILNVPVDRSDDPTSYEYYWFHLDDSEFDERDYLQIWLDQVLFCSSPSSCSSIASDDTIILQMFRSDCQLWTCQADGEGAGCEGRYEIGSPDDVNADFFYDDVSRFVLGGAGLSPCSLTAGSFFIKVSLPSNATYSLSVYLRSPPATFALPDAVAIRSTIFQSAFQHYSYTSSDSATALLSRIDVSLTEVACGHLELFAKHGTPAGPFFPTTLDRTTFIGSQMYNPNNVAGALGGFFGSGQNTRFIGSSLEKCASAYCATSDSDDSCTIQLGTTELSKNLDAAGSLGSTTWFFAVRVIDSNYTTDNDEADVFTGTPSSTVYGVGFFEPVTFFITAESFYTEVTANVQWGCSTSLTTDSDECADEEPSDDNTIPSIQFGFQTIGLFTDAYITTEDGESNSLVLLNATVVDLDKPDGVNQFVEPVWQIGDYGEWGRFVSNWAYITTDLSNYNSNDKPSGPQNIFVNVVDASSIFADFYHNPVPLIAPGVVYPGAGHDSDINPDDGPRFISSRYVFYEFSPALSSTPLFSLSTNANNGVPSCFAPRFWWSEDCGAFSPSSPNTESFFYSCGSDLPRFLSFRLEDCSASCSTLSCTDAFQWELSYQTSLPFTDLQLNVESCGAEWQSVQFTESLSADSTEYVLFSLPVDVDPSTPTQVSWLSLDFYPSLNDEIYDNDIWLFESSDLTCSGSFSDEQEGYFDHQNSFVCPQFSYMVVDTSSFLLDYSASAITATNFQFDVIDAGELTTASPGSELSITVTFADFTQFDLFYYYAVYSFTIPDSLVPIASELSIDVESDYCASSYNWWINYEVPLPPACDDLNDEITDCSLLPGTYFVSLQLSPYASDEAVPEFTSTIIVTLDTFDVLSVPEDGSFSATFTLEPFETVVLQTEFSPEWLTSHPALQSEALYRFISPLGLPTQAPVFASLAECFDCSSPVFSTKFTNEYETPFDVTIQFELMSDLLLNFDPSVATVGFPFNYWAVNYDVTNVQAPLMFASSYQGILAPYFDDRALTINTLSLGTSVDGSLYNAFTYRQLQVYLVSTVAANAIGQIRVSDVTGGLVSLQVFPATLDRNCGEFKECHSAPLHWSDDHGLLQANPLNNIAGSCSLVYSPCEWAAYPSYFVVVHDHVFNAVDDGASLNVYDTPYGSGPYDGFEIGYSNDNSTNYEDQTIGCFGFGCHQVTPTQDNPFVSTKFTLTATEEFYHTESFPTATQSFSSRPSPSERSLDNPAGNWQHFFYSYEASGVSSIVISVDVTSASALATSGVYVTVSDSDCGCSDFVRNIWCSAEYPSWLCEIEIPTHADHPLSSSTFYIDVYGLKGSFSLDVSEGLDNCVWSDGEDFCPTRVLNYAFWPTVPSSELDGKASCLYEELLTYFEDPACNDCLYDIPDECKVALQDYACAATFNPCDVDGFIDATICVDKCTAVEEACPYTFIEAGLVNLNCGHPRYSSTNCFE